MLRARGWMVPLLLVFTISLVTGQYFFKYPTNGQIIQDTPEFSNRRRPDPYPPEEYLPPCSFNTQCKCSSNSEYDLGVVFCEGVELAQVPRVLNSSKMHILTLRGNRLRHLNERSFYGTGLWRLEIRHNDIFRVPEKAFQGIERSLSELDMRYNHLSRMPREAIKGLRKLKTLDLSGNYIADISSEDFQGYNRYLKDLVLASNSLVEIPNEVFSSLGSLKKLELQDNNIRSIRNDAFKGASPALREINLEHNLLSSIPFTALSALRGLQNLNLARNLISQPYDVMFRNTLALDTLILDYNNIQHLPPHSFQNFDSVNISSFKGNPLQRIANDAFKGSKIRELYLQDCDVWNLSEKSFRGIEATLEVLDLSYNNLTEIPQNIFDRIDTLKWLSFGHNKLILDPKKSFNGFTYTLQYLNLLGEYMGIIPMDALKHMRNVRTFAFSTFPGYYLSNEDFLGFGPAVEKLYLMNNEITSIHALAFEHVPGLKVLDLSQNVISSLDNRAFNNVGGLEELRINSGLMLPVLPSFPMHSLVKLKILDLSYNKLTFVPNDCLRKMKQLTRINLEDNKINKLSRHLFKEQFTPNLEIIQLSFNSIKLIDSHTFHDISALKYVYLDDNQITRIKKMAFTNLENLEYLTLTGNNLRHLDLEAFQTMPKIQYLDLSFNELTNLNLDAFEQIGTLSTLKIDVSYNRISALSMNGSMWQSLASIKMIDFSHNNISVIARDYFESIRSSVLHLWFNHNNMYNLSSNIFAGMHQVQLLDFSHNHISIVDPEIFRGNDRLRSIDLSYNQIRDLPMILFENNRNLNYADLSGNLMSRMPDNLFRDTALEILKLSNNFFTMLPDPSLHHITETLRVLDLSHNLLTELSDAVVGHLENLISFDVSHNMIHNIGYRSFHGLYKLTHLDVSHNPVRDINLYTFDGLEASLQNLSIANTSINSLPEMHHSKLTFLNASHNVLSYLPTNIMANLSAIRVLDVSHNELTTPGSNAWQVMPYLRDVRLQGNYVRSITNSTFASLSRLEVLDARDFPLHVFQVGGLAPLKCLRSLTIDTQPNVPRFNLGAALSKVPSIQELILQVEGALGGELRGGSLPYRLANITLMGPRLRNISPRSLETVMSRNLRVTFKRTGLRTVGHNVFTHMGKTRFLAVGAYNNSNLKSLGEPYNTVTYPGARDTVFMTDFRGLESNKWVCDCGIGWLESWIKLWRSSVCVTDGKLDRFLHCQKTLHQLRLTPCSDKPKSLMEALKFDLECGVSGSSSLVSNFIVTVVIPGIYFKVYHWCTT